MLRRRAVLTHWRPKTAGILKSLPTGVGMPTWRIVLAVTPIFPFLSVLGLVHEILLLIVDVGGATPGAVVYLGKIILIV